MDFATDVARDMRFHINGFPVILGGGKQPKL